MNVNWETFKVALVKGLISLAWRVGSFIVAGLLALLVDSVGLLGFSPEITGIIGFILGEVTKQFRAWEKTKLGVARK